ncbi:MAG: ATP-binding protein [Gammaproteobacteria bacterium]|nr:ATP-binding protein [Gammaproteobacteria bacterium]
MTETTRGTVLIVEDDLGIATLERRALEKSGYKVFNAVTAAEALGIIQQDGIDVVVLDYILPAGITGLAFMAQLKANGYDLPIIMATGMSDDSTVIAALRSGVSDFIIKSVESISYLPLAVERIFVQINTRKKLAESEASLHEYQQQRIRELSAINAKMQKINHQLEEAHSQLLQSEKMASIGQLAAGVAHEINNPIGYVYSNLGSMQNYVQDILSVLSAYEKAEPLLATQPDAAQMLAAITTLKAKVDLTFVREDTLNLMRECKEGITRVKHIVQDLKDFSHVNSAEWLFADLHKGLNSTLNIVNNEVKYKADVIKEYGEVPLVECVASQINQVFMNLLVNAAHAIEERGTITLKTGFQDEQAWVSVTDTGKGIAPENLPRIFDPFFTTKPVGKGTGLGLSLAYSIISKHGGKIDVASQPGKGTCFTVWLPIQQSQDHKLVAQA